MAQLEREKERLDYERQMAQMYLLAAVGPWSDDGSRPTGGGGGDQTCRPLYDLLSLTPLSPTFLFRVSSEDRNI